MARLTAPKRREQLLDTAAELFARSGYARATTAQLAKAAGVTEPIIYRHFKSKRDLFIELIRTSAARTLKEWQELLKGAKDPAERVRRLLDHNPMVEKGRFAYRVLLQAITEVNDAEIKKAVVEHMTELHGFLKREIAAAQKKHKVPDATSPELIAWILIHIGLGYGVLDALGVPHQGMDKKGVSVRDVLERNMIRAG
ncbi:MAG: TetR/AcrR family transcriptional regulator [Phycisphaerales bacterium]|jgi:AcrR family transcriptional regulator|nr:TetR/AcrR family transcriptional regulator [Phycisphaerales bacterium]